MSDENADYRRHDSTCHEHQKEKDKGRLHWIGVEMGLA